MPYAEKTDVPADRSKAEIERLLQKHGANQFAYMADRSQAILLFRIDNRQIKMLVPLPDLDSFRLTPGGRLRTASAGLCVWRWRETTRRPRSGSANA
jgi:hypothetical protein